MTLAYAESVRHARLDAVTAAIDAGAAAGTIKIYDGTRPATGVAITDQTLLVSGAFTDPAAPAASAGVLGFSTITYATAVASGTATWCRVADSDGTFVFDGDVGEAGSGADFVLNSTGIVVDGVVTHIEASITAGNP